ncbi:MAG: hypothetical protein Q8L49_06500 [Burkholderiaceae bacterium]|nr:hypothetical protein [Burkholderiaceae bacterium]
MNVFTATVVVALAVGATACASPSSTAPSPASAAAPPAAAPAAKVEHLSGKVVWVDLKNSSLLVECQNDEGCKAVKGKKGETYPSLIPASLKGAAGSWAEGSLVTVTYEDRPDGGRVIQKVVAK